MQEYEPPLSRIGAPLGMELEEIYPGVTGYAVERDGQIYIPLICGNGNGAVGQMLDALSIRCHIVNVCNPILRDMLRRRGWRMQIVEVEPTEYIDIWTKQKKG